MSIDNFLIEISQGGPMVGWALFVTSVLIFGLYYRETTAERKKSDEKLAAERAARIEDLKEANQKMLSVSERLISPVEEMRKMVESLFSNQVKK